MAELGRPEEVAKNSPDKLCLSNLTPMSRSDVEHCIRTKFGAPADAGNVSVDRDGNSKTSDQVLEWTWRGKLRDQENQKSVNQLHYKVT